MVLGIRSFGHGPASASSPTTTMGVNMGVNMETVKHIFMVTPMLTLLLDNVDCSSQHYLVLLQMQLQQLPWEWTITWILDFIADWVHFSTNHACRNNFKSDINYWYFTFTVATCKMKNVVVSPKLILIITFDFHLNHSILLQWGNISKLHTHLFWNKSNMKQSLNFTNIFR